ncbi:precorrin-2 C(20)-methyltransferase [Swingsia samuiensis]|uniref:Precorrin-2 C(20)-methyltransferase n=1 Tax=Swingsia samuiensis TaxID=1293412 RepID=A0A4Y6UJL2_9PROT|nr:precorrin-2 C(20)-methyltransferase [Swingsia samuiensis]QDH17752.1 precorrin-2 C(20)-methyltransferase [Swingsia samuiensis]
MSLGRLHIVGVGPGDPELLTVKAARVIGHACVVAFFSRHGRVGHARTIADQFISSTAQELRFVYPFTTERSVNDPSYHEDMSDFYDDCAEKIRHEVHKGQNVVLLCEGDPFLYGSAMYIFDRLHISIECEIVPGITAMSGCWSEASLPITHGDDVLCVLPATMEEDDLADWLCRADAAVIMKLGRNMPKLRKALERAGRLDKALYVERGTQHNSKVMRLVDVEGNVPYFSLVLLSGRQNIR